MYALKLRIQYTTKGNTWLLLGTTRRTNKNYKFPYLDVFHVHLKNVKAHFTQVSPGVSPGIVHHHIAGYDAVFGDSNIVEEKHGFGRVQMNEFVRVSVGQFGQENFVSLGCCFRKGRHVPATPTWNSSAPGCVDRLWRHSTLELTRNSVQTECPDWTAIDLGTSRTRSISRRSKLRWSSLCFLRRCSSSVGTCRRIHLKGKWISRESRTRNRRDFKTNFQLNEKLKLIWLWFLFCREPSLKKVFVVIGPWPCAGTV